MDYYEIVVENHIDRKRLREFSPMEWEHLGDGRTRLNGMLKDQAELFSMMSKIRDMNLKLILVKKNNVEMEERK